MFVRIASKSLILGSQVQAEAANDAPDSPVDANANANVLQLSRYV